MYFFFFFFFFFQAEDGIRDDLVTGVQTCALPILDPELDADVPALAAHQRVDHGIHVPALAVQQQQPPDVATELELFEQALLAQAEQADREGAREPARVGRPDRGAQRVVVDGVIALEGKPAHHPLRLLLRGEGSRREHGDENGQAERAQLTQWGWVPMLACSPRTVNLFDTWPHARTPRSCPRRPHGGRRVRRERRARRGTEPRLLRVLRPTLPRSRPLDRRAHR